MSIRVSTAAGCHAGVVFIAPPRPVPLFGYAARQPKAVAAPPSSLEADWLAYPVAGGIGLLISIDTLFSSELFETALRLAFEERALSLASLVVVASHTHFAPGLDPDKPALGPVDEDYLAWVCGALAEDVATTLRAEPVRIAALRQGMSEAPGSVYRRAWGVKVTPGFPFLKAGTQLLPDPSVKIPKACRLWVFEEEGGKSAFVIASWPCHPVSRAKSGECSADYVGVLRAAIRQALGEGVPVLFIPGPSADIRPWFRPPLLSRKRLYPFPLQRSFDQASKAQEAAFDGDVESAVHAALADAHPLKLKDHIGIARQDVPHAKFAQGAGAASMGVTALDIMGVRILGLGAEVSMRWLSVIGWDDASRTDLLTGYMGPTFGYLPTDQQIPEGGYEVEGFCKPFGFEGRYSPDLPINKIIATACEAALADLQHSSIQS